ncbi:MAG TPA: PDDEXK nuclease domain-containing protein [Solirubrobacteraceae bacterium]|jgi:predicted nuclease of restriction endonuclease-like (RecB) superfamily|nr:PDDEXK nuclease domain-containing protein [Solirubrobacteraceae bacterium]
MPDLPVPSPIGTPESASAISYEEFLEDIKGRIRSAQARAARAISAELIAVYWQIGREIVRRQAEEGDRRGRGGPKVIERLSADLRAAFPGARGYSVSSLRYMRAFATAWPEREMLQSGVGALPWGHIVLLLDRLADRSTRDWYAARASSWSRVQLETAIMSHLHEREGAAVTNFERTLEAGDAEAVQRIARDPVVLDFVQLTDGAKERDLEAALLVDIERFMLALGEGFYFAGRQKSLEIGGEEFILDLLFYHHPTRRFVVIDLKIGRFQAEFAGKMNLYVNAVNKLIAHDGDRATVGFILCAGRNEAVAHMTLQGIATPIAVTRYTVGARGVLMANEESQITEGIEREMEGMRRVEQQVAEFAARRARELAEGSDDPKL